MKVSESGSYGGSAAGAQLAHLSSSVGSGWPWLPANRSKVRFRERVVRALTVFPSIGMSADSMFAVVHGWDIMLRSCPMCV